MFQTNTMPSLFIIPSSFIKQRGASSLENTVAILVFLLIALAAFESTHWLLLRQALNTALLDTARIAATQQAHPQIINEAFAASIQKLPAFAFKAEHEKHWHIEKITSSSPSNQPIQHDYQALQYLQGNTQIFEDNTLHLRLHYLHKPLTPLVRAAIYAYAKGYVPIVTDIKVAMQSDQALWQKPSAAPAWVPASSMSPVDSAATVGSLPEPAAPPLPPWQPSLPPNTWQPPNGNSPPYLEGCDSDFCCAPIATNN